MSELETLSEVNIPIRNVIVKISFPFRKISEEKRIVAGYCSIDQVDLQNEKIPVSVLKDAWSRCFKGQVRSHLMHTSIPVGEILDEYEEEDGTVHKSGVDDTGLYIVSKVWDNTNKANETWDLIQQGVLRAYSIGGEALGENTKVCNGEVCYERINNMDFHEISYVDKPANPDSIFRILKRDNVELPNIIHISKDLLLKPIPKPKSGEEQDKYISRCVSAVADADPKIENKQRVAICYNTYRESKKGETTLLSDLLRFTDVSLYEKIQKQNSRIEELYDVFLVRRETKFEDSQMKVETTDNLLDRLKNEQGAKKLELFDGDVHIDDVANATQQTDSAVGCCEKVESVKKILVKVKLHGDN